MIKKIFIFLVLVFLTAAIGAGALGYSYYLKITKDLPDFATIDDYRPNAASKVVARDGTIIAELYKERRYPLRLDQIPPMVRNCFLAAEDASFYSHPGIDVVSIIRAAVKNFTSGKATQGASTITQQVVKNLLLTPEKKLERKIKEAILSYRLEKRLSKDEILDIYLNEIFFGNNAYGIEAAARAYFHKNVTQLTLAEAAILAGLPKAPSKYSPVVNMPRAKERQGYVLTRMRESKFATEEEVEVARNEKIVVYPSTAQNIFSSPYYVTEVREEFRKKWPELNIDTDGLEISVADNLKAEDFAQEALTKGLKEVDKRRGWRGPLATKVKVEDFIKKYGARTFNELQGDKIYPALIKGIDIKGEEITVTLGKEEKKISIKDINWAKKRIFKDNRSEWGTLKQALLSESVIEVSKKEEGLILDQTPDIEGAITLLDPYSGEVLAMRGGYSFERSQFNRVTQSLRQPGSSFKPIVYLSAIDGYDYTPSTIVSDAPRTFKWGDDYWTPHNFDSKFLGAITLQTALEKSRNLVSADIVSKIGVSAPIE